MYLVILLAAAAILGGVVVVAMGRGGEMALFAPDLPVKITRLETPGDVATMHLPLGLVGYQARATGEALIATANLLARRDAEIAALRREVWRLGGDGQMSFVMPADRSAGGPAGGSDGGSAGGSDGGSAGADDPGEEAPVDQGVDQAVDQAVGLGSRQEQADQAGQP